MKSSGSRRRSSQRLQILLLELLVDLGLTVSYLALLNPADGPVELDLGIDQLRCPFLVTSQERLEGVPHGLDVLLRHRTRIICDCG